MKILKLELSRPRMAADSPLRFALAAVLLLTLSIALVAPVLANEVPPGLINKWGSPGGSDGQFNDASGIAIDSDGNICVADVDYDSIREASGESSPWLTFLGGSGYEEGIGIARDSTGNVYVSGRSQGGWAQPGDGDPVRPHSEPIPPDTYDYDAFAAKLDDEGNLIWYTFLGGPGNDYGYGIAVDDSGNVFVTGLSDNYAWAQTGDGDPVRAHSSSEDAFVVKLDADDGSLSWYTFLGGDSSDSGVAVAVDGAGNICVAGRSYTAWTGGLLPVRSHSGSGYDIFVATLDTDDGSLSWYTFLGGDGEESSQWNCGIAADGDSIYVTSSGVSRWTEDAVNEYSGGKDDAFVARLDADDGSLTWHTFMGSGDSDYGYDYGEDVAVDDDGNAFITGYSYESWGNDPVRDFGGGVFDAFVARLDSDGSLTWNTFLGGSGGDSGYGIALDTISDVFVTGSSYANWGSPEQDHSGGEDVFVAKLTSNGTLLWNTFAGGGGNESGLAIDVDEGGLVSIAGTGDTDWDDPVRDYSGWYDGLVLQLQSGGAATETVDLVLTTGWNMVSVPLELAEGDDTVAAVFQEEIDGIYGWNPVAKSYESPETIQPEIGYWVHVTADKTITITGTPVTSWEEYPLIAGWNMVGSVCGNPVAVSALDDDPADSILTGSIYGWNPTAKSYDTADHIVQGLGYWMSTTVNCTLTMTAP